MFRRSLLIALLTALPSLADVTKILAEPNLERRSALALEEVDFALTSARKAYESQQFDDFRKQLADAAEMTQLCYQSLQDSGKRARRSPKWFKHAEQRLLVIQRRVDALVKDVSADDRPPVEAVQVKIREIHDQVLQDIMSRK